MNILSDLFNFIFFRLFFISKILTVSPSKIRLRMNGRNINEFIYDFMNVVEGCVWLCTCTCMCVCTQVCVFREDVREWTASIIDSYENLMSVCLSVYIYICSMISSITFRPCIVNVMKLKAAIFLDTKSW